MRPRCRPERPAQRQPRPTGGVRKKDSARLRRRLRMRGLRATLRAEPREGRFRLGQRRGILRIERPRHILRAAQPRPVRRTVQPRPVRRAIRRRTDPRPTLTWRIHSPSGAHLIRRHRPGRARRDRTRRDRIPIRPARRRTGRALPRGSTIKGGRAVNSMVHMASAIPALATFAGKHSGADRVPAFFCKRDRAPRSNREEHCENDWRRWFRACSSGTGVWAGRNLLCYNFCRLIEKLRRLSGRA
jgi:hypothetical protein